MNDDIKVTRALSNLNKLTKEGSIKWEKKIIPKDWFPGDVDEKVINPAFDCQYDSSYMRIFKYIYKSYQDIDEYHEVLGVKLCFLDLSGNIVWELFMIYMKLLLTSYLELKAL